MVKMAKGTGRAGKKEEVKSNQHGVLSPSTLCLRQDSQAIII